MHYNDLNLVSIKPRVEKKMEHKNWDNQTKELSVSDRLVDRTALLRREATEEQQDLFKLTAGPWRYNRSVVMWRGGWAS